MNVRRPTVRAEILLNRTGDPTYLPREALSAFSGTHYVQVLGLYLLAMGVFWALGVEAIYGSPLPFYALLYPANATLLAPLLIPGLAALGYVGVRHYLFVERTRQYHWFKRGLYAYLTMLAVLAAGSLIASGHPLAWLNGLWLDVRWHLPALTVFSAFAFGFTYALNRLDWLVQAPSPRATRWLLTGLVAFAILFSASVAMVRNGPDGISQAYARHGYEYAGDIGMTGSIYKLFHEYEKYRPHLSMHAKVHPPGPIAALWLVSYVSGQEPFGLSLATIFLGALGVLPLYLLANAMAGRRVALTCAVLYVLMPSIVLFTATSADILFLPVVLTALWLFWVALHKPSIPAALGAGALYGVASLLSFSLLTLGAFFAAVGLLRWMEPVRRRAVVQTAALMLGAFLAVHGAVWLWSGFNYVACYHACKGQFDLDQLNLDVAAPRFPWWAWKVLNPACWFYFAGIPVSVLFIRRLWRPARTERNLFLAVAIAVAVMTLFYLGRGEGERSAMYILPLVVIPAGHMLDEAVRGARSTIPLLTAAVVLAFQCWLTETIFYTFW